MKSYQQISLPKQPGGKGRQGGCVSVCGYVCGRVSKPDPIKKFFKVINMYVGNYSTLGVSRGTINNGRIGNVFTRVMSDIS